MVASLADAKVFVEQPFQLSFVSDLAHCSNAIHALNKAIPAHRQSALMSFDRAYASLREVAARRRLVILAHRCKRLKLTRIKREPIFSFPG